MKKVLGIDIGPSAIGWALVDEDYHQILGVGTRIFPVGVANLGEGSNEISKNALRTGSRGTRRLYFRRKLRKKTLLKALIQNYLCPLSTETLLSFQQNKKFPSTALASWFALNPYELRARAIKEPISLHELGRIFYHFIQRRGYLSNSRKSNTDEEGTIFKGNPREGKVGILETQEKIQSKTLGAYLFDLQPKPRQPYTLQTERIRNRYTTRQMYIDEFEQIWEFQAKYHPSLNPSLKALLGGRRVDKYPMDGILFHQRPLRSQKHLIGKCALEPTKTKCPISALPYEEFKIWQWVNTLECNGKKIDATEKEIVIDLLYSFEKIEFKKIRKALKKEGKEYKFNFKDDEKISGSSTISHLSNKKMFGKRWFSFSEKEQEDIWHVLYFFESKSKLKVYAKDHWQFTEEQAEAISNYNLQAGFANISRKAITNILPFLKMGYTYEVALILGGVKNAFGTTWEDLSMLQKNYLLDTVEGIVKSKTKGGIMDLIGNILQTEFKLSEKATKKLYQQTTAIQSAILLKKLPTDLSADREILSIRNPIVIAALFELRKLVNELLSQFGSIDEIKVELARDLKANKTKRYEYRKEQKRQEKLNERIKEEFSHLNLPLTTENLLKYKLWEECRNKCPFTGEEIPLSELFTNKWQITHIHPWSRSVNDSFLNKTLCSFEILEKKGDQTPYEFLGQDENKWAEIKDRVLKQYTDTKDYPKAYAKFKRFVQKHHDDDFMSKQMDDSQFICKEAKNYLSKVCRRVIVCAGFVTGQLRYKWGLNNLLTSKLREDDHRYHAIDALVLCCTNMSYVQALAKWSQQEKGVDLRKFILPWPTFRADALEAIQKMLVSYKQVNSVITRRKHISIKNGIRHENIGVAARGLLHKETVYGKRKIYGEEGYHVRKAIESLQNQTHIEKIVDESIRKLIYKRIEQLGGFQGEKVPANTYFEIDETGKKIPKVFLPNRNGEPVPILKVRIRETLNKAKPLKKDINQYVNPRNNDHLLIYETPTGELDKSIVSFWEVVERKVSKKPSILLPENGTKIVEYFKENDLFILFKNPCEIQDMSQRELANHLYKVQKIAGGEYFMEICFRKHTDGRDDKNAKADYVYIKGFGDGKTGWHYVKPQRVELSVAGNIKIKQLEQELVKR